MRQSRATGENDGCYILSSDLPHTEPHSPMYRYAHSIFLHAYLSPPQDQKISHTHRKTCKNLQTHTQQTTIQSSKKMHPSTNLLLLLFSLISSSLSLYLPFATPFITSLLDPQAPHAPPSCTEIINPPEPRLVPNACRATILPACKKLTDPKPVRGRWIWTTPPSEEGNGCALGWYLPYSAKEVPDGLDCFGAFKDMVDQCPNHEAGSNAGSINVRKMPSIFTGSGSPEDESKMRWVVAPAQLTR